MPRLRLTSHEPIANEPAALLQAEAACSLEQLEHVERLIASVVAGSAVLRENVQRTQALLSRLRATPPKNTVDPEGHVVAAFRQALVAVQSVIERIDEAIALRADESVLTELRAMRECAEALHDVDAELIDYVLTNDALHGPAGASYTDPSALMADLRRRRM